jgi:hypothetical protein
MNASLRSLVLAAAAMACLAGSSALAQERPRPAEPLRGPQVEENRPRYGEERFTQPGRPGPWGPGAGGGAGGMMLQRGVPHPEFMSIVWMLRDEEAPRGLRLTREQERKIAELDEQFQQAAREHSQKLRELARAAREEQPEAEAQQRDDGEQRPDGRRRITESDRERIEQLRESMPRPADTQTKIYAQLSEIQRSFVEDELAERRRAAERQREQEMMRRFREWREAGGQPGQGPFGRGGFGGPEAQAQRERMGRVMQGLSQLTPEEREQILARVEQEVERRLAARGETIGEGRGFQRWRGMRQGEPAGEGRDGARREGGENEPARRFRRPPQQRDPEPRR